MVVLPTALLSKKAAPLSPVVAGGAPAMTTNVPLETLSNVASALVALVTARELFWPTGDVPSWAVGLAAGLVVAIGGSEKDAPYEGFNLATFVRSPIVGSLVGVFLERQLQIKEPAALFLATIGGERIVVECYKVVRALKPGKFTYGEYGIPKQLAQDGGGGKNGIR